MVLTVSVVDKCTVKFLASPNKRITTYPLRVLEQGHAFCSGKLYTIWKTAPAELLCPGKERCLIMRHYVTILIALPIITRFGQTHQVTWSGRHSRNPSYMEAVFLGWSISRASLASGASVCVSK